MHVRTMLVLLSVGVAGAVLALACTTDYQKGLEDPNFGAPNALAGQRQPGPSSEATSDGGGGDDDDVPVCVKGGGTLVDGGPCAVSLANDILPAFGTANCQTAGSCHGGATPPNLPRIEPSDGPAMWKEFQKFQLGDKPYINPCSTNPADSTIACNVNRTGTCGTLMPPSAGLDPAIVTKIEDWLKCGSPNN